jgi:lambda family phage portal protein
MNFWQSLWKIFSSNSKLFRKRAYNGTDTGRLTSDWIASSTSADSEIYGSLVRLRNRARQLVRDNDYARGALRTITNNVIGQGIPFNSQVKMRRGDRLDETTNTAIEQAWQEWGCKEYCDVAGKLGWPEIQRLSMRSVVESGEILIRKVKQSFGGSSVPFAIELIEADQLAESHNGKWNGNEIRMGIEVDQWQRPVAYWLHSHHPGDYQFGISASKKLQRIPAEEIIHLFFCDRPGQSRGVSWFHSCLKRMRDLGGYEEAEIVAARATASIMGFIETPDGELLGEEVSNNGERLRSLSPGTIELLAPGEKFSGFSPTRPATGFDSFVRMMLRGMAAGVGISYENLSADYSQSNYSSSRLALLNDRDTYRALQTWIILNLHQPIYEAWLDMAVLSGKLRLPIYELEPHRYRSVRWQPRGWSWVDPQKEINATISAVGAGLTTLTDEIAKQGGDIEDLLKSRKRELDMAASYGLSLYTPLTQSSVLDESEVPDKVSNDISKTEEYE